MLTGPGLTDPVLTGPGLTGPVLAASGGFSGRGLAGGLPVTLGAVAALFLLTFAAAVRLRRHAVVDQMWGVGFVVVAAVSYALSTGGGDGGRRALVTALTAAWGLRLAAHIHLRSRGRGEDPRYVAILARAPANPNAYALRAVYLTQAAVLWFVSLPVQVAQYQRAGLGPLDAAAVAVWAVGLSFEAVGDWQLTRFRRDPANRARVLRTGLWRYSRHPNYFGDACVWWGLFLLAAGHWPGPLFVASPVLMTWLLANGSGKPILEAQLLRTRPGYEEYVRCTSGFVPRPPRRAPTRTGG